MNIYSSLKDKTSIISVTGLGYVGLPLALELAKHFKVIGFDLNASRVSMMKKGLDPSRELSKEDFKNVDIAFTSNGDDLKRANFHIVCVPTDIHKDRSPNLEPLKLASQTIGKILKQGDYVVYESTVFPGCTEEVCLPILQEESQLTLSPNKEQKGFYLGYSPERIVPGKQSKKLNEITKIVSGNCDFACQQITNVYSEIISEGVYTAPSIKVAEAAKVLENTQRDLNISLMNEMAIICDKLGIATSDVIDAAGTKWNFHTYRPGLVGGHCISIDPFVLISKSRELGHEPEVIAAGRRVNEFLPSYIAERMLNTLKTETKEQSTFKVLVMGATFKENISDIRNSKVGDLIRELESRKMEVDLLDSHVDRNEVEISFGKTPLTNIKSKYDAVIVAVAHEEYKTLDANYFKEILTKPYVLFDLKGVYSSEQFAEFKSYWKL